RNVLIDVEWGVRQRRRDRRPVHFGQRRVRGSRGADLFRRVRRGRQTLGPRELTVQIVEAVILEVDDDDVIHLRDVAGLRGARVGGGVGARREQRGGGDRRAGNEGHHWARSSGTTTHGNFLASRLSNGSWQLWSRSERLSRHRSHGFATAYDESVIDRTKATRSDLSRAERCNECAASACDETASPSPAPPPRS